MTDQEFLRLLEKYRRQQLSSEEMSAFMKAVAAGEHRALVQEDILHALAGDNAAASSWCAEDEAMVLSQLLERTRASQPAPVRPLRSYRWVAAAMLLLLGGAAFWLLRENNRAIAPAPAHKAAGAVNAPGSDKALLTLADGTVVALDSAHGNIPPQGNVSLQAGKGMLVYTGNSEQSGPVAYNTLRTPRGGQYQLVLPDGSRVWLNAASSIRFPTSFSGSTRTVELTGEAYFEVAQQASRPFHVKSGNMDIAVLGTQFNVMAYEGEDAIKTTLLQGAVKVSSGSESRVLQPGQQSQLDAKGKMKVIADADTEQAIAWKNGYTSFKSADIKTIMRQVERWYDVEVVYQGNVPERTFTGDIPREAPLSGFLQLLQASNIHFKMEGQQIIIMP